MNPLAILDLAALAAFISNVVHWAICGRRKLLYWPGGWAVNAQLVAIIVLAPLILLHLVQDNLFLVLMGSYLLSGSLFSIWHRQRTRRLARPTAVA